MHHNTTAPLHHHTTTPIPSFSHLLSHFKFENFKIQIGIIILNLTTDLNTCTCVLLLNFFSKLTNLSWMRRNTNVNFVIKFSVMEKAEIGMRRFVYFSLFLSRVNVLREFFFSFIYFLFFFN